MLVNYKTKITLNLLCFIKRSKANPSQKVPLYLRISLNEERVEISLKRFIDASQWDSKRQQLKGRTEEAKTVNEYIRLVKNKLYDHYNTFLAQGKVLTALSLKNSYLGIGDEQKTVLQAFAYHNERQKQQIGKGVAKGTCERYDTCYKHIKEFIEWKFKRTDIFLSELNYQAISDLEFYLRTERQCNNNTTLKYISNFKKVVNLARKLGWLSFDPFFGFKGALEPVDRDYLTEAEVLAIANKDFGIERLNLVKDIFVFSCFTGLAYVDVSKLSKEHITIGIDKEKWVHLERTKTGVTSKIPLLPVALKLIEKYKNHPQCLRTGKLFPILSNQKMNAYLKEIADVCKINKHLTFHVSRHTFATSITLANKVPMESVSKMLGHKSIKTTQIYSRVLDKKVSDDMSHLFQKFSNENANQIQPPKMKSN
jgi:integrase